MFACIPEPFGLGCAEAFPDLAHITPADHHAFARLTTVVSRVEQVLDYGLAETYLGRHEGLAFTVFKSFDRLALDAVLELRDFDWEFDLVSGQFIAVSD